MDCNKVFDADKEQRRWSWWLIPLEEKNVCCRHCTSWSWHGPSPNIISPCVLVSEKRSIELLSYPAAYRRSALGTTEHHVMTAFSEETRDLPYLMVGSYAPGLDLWLRDMTAGLEHLACRWWLKPSMRSVYVNPRIRAVGRMENLVLPYVI